MKMNFGHAQVLTSDKMKRYPSLSKIVYSVFGYTNIGNYARAKIFTDLLNVLPLQSFKKALDLGCGYGEYSFMLAEHLKGAEITSLDIDEERIEIVRRTKNELGISNVKIHKGLIETLDEESSYDFIFSVDVFEHIYEQEMPFQECFKKLKPGGYLLVKMPNITQLTILPSSFFEEHKQWLDDEHIGQVYDLEALKARFRKEGFKVLYASYSDGIFSRMAWELGFLAKKGGSVLQLLCLPMAKMLINIDKLFNNSKIGNAIQVIGVKP